MASAVASGSLAAQERTTEHELDLIRGAIALIVSGAASRVTLVATRLAERIVPEARILAAEHGIIVRAVWRPELDGCDIVVEPIG
jgi:hypothetical protein